MERSYKFRLYPNREQEILIQKTFGCVRFVYNHFLDERIQQYSQAGKAPTRFQQDKSLTTLKKELEWLREPDKCALQEALKSGCRIPKLFPACQARRKAGVSAL